MVHCDFEWGFIADLNHTIILMLAHAHCVDYYFQHAHGRHRITVNTHQNENRFLAFGSLISNAEAENATISDSIIGFSKFSGI